MGASLTVEGERVGKDDGSRCDGGRDRRLTNEAMVIQ